MGKVEKRKTLKGPHMQDLDRALYLWFQARRSEGKAVSGPVFVRRSQEAEGRPWDRGGVFVFRGLAA